MGGVHTRPGHLNGGARCGPQLTCQACIADLVPDLQQLQAGDWVLHMALEPWQWETRVVHEAAAGQDRSKLTQVTATTAGQRAGAGPRAMAVESIAVMIHAPWQRDAQG